jgi:hypothetical protein
VGLIVARFQEQKGTLESLVTVMSNAVAELPKLFAPDERIFDFVADIHHLLI